MAEEILEQLAECIIKGKAPDAKELTQKALDDGVDVSDVLNQGLVAGMSVIGDRFKRNEVYVPEVLIAARAMKAGMELLRPLLKEGGIEAKAIVCVGTVKGDLHDIGKNLVCMMLEGAGFEVVDLGVNVEPEKFVAGVQENNANAIGMSALLTTTMTSMKTTIDAFAEAGCRDQVKIMVGGAPLTQNFADEIGADGYAPDAASAVDLVNELLGL
ncbi:MAG: corrinoid protein [Lentisphaerae bacterium]|nr:corrinoid protein [Lentisphaerota bacterium]MBT4814631.1 corrinoid protein [Lentisphaerota bacterium]MBT5605461.1 corrinoid protein [Lentisphaerota bacterium]MBT7060108.1 corrinoid protein [Lentisphaerota bacterium]MBT7840832.1 corrinoid protein [Lentisphaerota bacterium]